MTTTTSRRAGSAASRTWPQWALAVTLAFVSVNAIYGGIGLMANGMGMPDDWLERTPFGSWVLPGVALLLTVAVPQLWAMVVAWRGGPMAPRVALLVGVALVLWIVVQLLVLRRYFFLQPVIAGLGLLEVVLALVWSRRRAGSPDAG